MFLYSMEIYDKIFIFNKIYLYSVKSIYIQWKIFLIYIFMLNKKHENILIQDIFHILPVQLTV